MTQGASILIVEDSPTQALALRRLLEAEGYVVAWAPTGEAALQMLNRNLPDLVVADLKLPGMDGRELARHLRLNGRTRALPVLMLTSGGAQDLERQGLESGADAYVEKSAGPDEVLARLRALLRRSLPQDHLRPGGFEPFRRARLLIIHDSPTMRLRLSQILAQEGYEVADAGDAEAALAEAVRGYDCVVVPVSGARLEGLALCHDLDARRADLESPFQIVAVGDESRDALNAAFDAGADEVAPLSSGDDILRVRVRALMRRKLLADETQRIERDVRARELAVAEARAEAASAEARAALADALGQANAELAAANRRLRDAQTQLVQAAKMASLGELVAGIAHEINNPLAFILGHQDTVERLAEGAMASDAGLSGPELMKARDRLASMRVGLRRIQDLVLNLRKFSRLDEADRQTLDVPDAIETVLALLSPKIGGIEVRRRYEAPKALEGSSALLNQVVMNILSNAADALGGRGEIEIATWLELDSYIIEISDSGPGVPEGLRERIFEPFFTTKPVGAGTGLGLAIAYRVVEAHGGALSVGASALGGAAFRISIPITGAP